MKQLKRGEERPSQVGIVASEVPRQEVVGSMATELKGVVLRLRTRI